ncbi:MAG: PKD domain-containing protein, partial [Bacteroidota bacterium]
ATGSPTNGTTFGGNASTAGVWYTGDDFPPQYKNTYFHADYGGGWIRNLQLDGSDQLNQVNNFIDSDLSIVCLTTNPTTGGLYYIQYGGTPFVNEVRKLYFSANHPPRAKAQADQFFGPGPLKVNFTSTGTTDPDGEALTYHWDFGDGNVSADANPEHTFTAAAGVPTHYQVTLTVTDAQAASSEVTLIISVNNTPPTVHITSPINNAFYPLTGAKIYTLNATVTDQEQTSSGLSYQWQTILHHNNHEHPDPYDTNRVTTTEISPVGCDGETYYFRVVLKVTDAAGLSATDEVKLYPDCQSLAPNITAINASSANSQVSLSWKNPTVQFDEIMVVAKPNASITASPSGNGSAYTADLNYAGTGSIFDGGKVVYKGTATPQIILALVNNTPYFFKIFVRTSTYWSSGVEIKAIPGCPAPSVQASSVSFSSISTRSMSLSWVNGSGMGRIAKINTTAQFTSPANGVSPSANAIYQGSGEQVIFNGSGNTVNITGLLPGVTYYVKVYEYNCTGDALVYSPNTANPASQLTNSSACTATGTLLREVWTNVVGSAVSTIPIDLPPTSSSQVNIFQGPTVASNKYGSRYRGYLCVPNSGNYTFWISSDNDSELWLSTDTIPENKVKIAYLLDGYAYPNQWTKYPSQQSTLVALEAGKRYYVEALHKQEAGGDNLMVGWQLPGGAMERPIPGIRFSPYIIPVITTVEEERITGNSLTVHPNPFSAKATVEVTLEKAAQAQLQLYDLRGAMIKRLFEGKLAGKTHRFELDGNQLSEGIYIIQLTTPNGVIHQKVVLYK